MVFADRGTFYLTQQFAALIAGGCGGNGKRIRQTFGDVLRKDPDFHSDPISIIGFCSACNYVGWEALTFVPSIVIPAEQQPSRKNYKLIADSLIACPHCKGRGMVVEQTRGIKQRTISTGRRISRIAVEED